MAGQHADGTLDIAYDDGDSEKHVNPMYVKPPHSGTQRPPPRAGAAAAKPAAPMHRSRAVPPRAARHASDSTCFRAGA